MKLMGIIALLAAAALATVLLYERLQNDRSLGLVLDVMAIGIVAALTVGGIALIRRPPGGIASRIGAKRRRKSFR